MKNSIPTKCNLKRRMIITEDCCDHCRSASEDVVHAVWSCSNYHRYGVITHDTCWQFRASMVFESFKELTKYIIERSLNLEAFAMMVWMGWYHRNLLRKSSKDFLVEQVILEVQSLQSSFVKANPPKPPNFNSQTPQREVWKPPSWPVIKVNFIGSVFKDEDSAGVGVVIRDDKGNAIASISNLFKLPYSPNAVEIIETTTTLRFALDIELSSIVLEGDSKTTIDALQSKGPSLAEVGNLIEEAKLLAIQFTIETVLDFLLHKNLLEQELQSSVGRTQLLHQYHY